MACAHVQPATVKAHAPVHSRFRTSGFRPSPQEDIGATRKPRLTCSGRSLPEQIEASAAQAAFGRRLVTNVHRGLVAEAIIAHALGAAWNWCSGDYAAWDFERSDGLRLEVKQTASRQSWHKPGQQSTGLSFDIRERTGRFEGATWIGDQRRWADLYVFAHHHVTNDAADHRDPNQWHFYVVPERALPAQKRITLSRVRRCAEAVTFERLAAVVHGSAFGRISKVTKLC